MKPHEAKGERACTASRRNIMDWNGYIQLWSEAHTKILDARQKSMERGDNMAVYRLPASAFIFIVQGNGHIELGQHVYEMERFQVYHAGKGMPLKIIAEHSMDSKK